MEELTATLRDWYFDTGGISLSPSAREAYFRVQRTLTTIIESERWRREGHDSIDAETFQRLFAIASRLRTRLTLDVGTRRPFSLEQPDDLLPEDRRDPNEIWISERWPRPGHDLDGVTNLVTASARRLLEHQRPALRLVVGFIGGTLSRAR